MFAKSRDYKCKEANYLSIYSSDAHIAFTDDREHIVVGFTHVYEVDRYVIETLISFIREYGTDDWNYDDVYDWRKNAT